jgi:activating signal cointegrator complex subunit 1
MPGGRARPTHFLSLPIGHHAGLRTAATALIDSLFPPALDPPIANLQRKYVEPPARLHVTLGVMQLADPETTGRALALLASLRQPLLDLLADRMLRIKVSGLGSFPVGSPCKVRVLWAVPQDPPGQEGLLDQVAGMPLRLAVHAHTPMHPSQILLTPPFAKPA